MTVLDVLEAELHRTAPSTWLTWLLSLQIDDVNCAFDDPELFFNGNEIEAKEVCYRCPVRPSCAEVALATNENYDGGVWGGTTEKERDAVRQGKTSLTKIEKTHYAQVEAGKVGRCQCLWCRGIK